MGVEWVLCYYITQLHFNVLDSREIYPCCKEDKLRRFSAAIFEKLRVVPRLFPKKEAQASVT
jgi:hypothetical protein